MRVEELRSLRAGDRVRFSLRRPRGAALVGTVTGAGVGVGGLYYAQVEWDGQESYSRHSRFSADWADAGARRRLRKADVAHHDEPVMS